MAGYVALALGVLLLVAVMLVYLKLRELARRPKVTEAVLQRLGRIDVNVEQLTNGPARNVNREPSESRAPAAPNVKPDLDRLVARCDDSLAATRTLLAAVEQLRSTLSYQPKEIAKALDALQTERERREREERKQAFSAEARQKLADLDRLSPPMTAIARATGRLLDGLGQDARELLSRFEPYTRVAQHQRDVESRLKVLQSAGPAEAGPAQQRITRSLQDIEQEASRLPLKLPVFCLLLDAAGTVAGRTVDRTKLMELLGVAEVRPKRGEVISDRDIYEVAKDLGQGRQMTIDSVELCGYVDVRSGAVLRKPRVVVQRRAEA